jgi:hypothetical protein
MLISISVLKVIDETKQDPKPDLDLDLCYAVSKTMKDF